jgi:hypothetical protein
MGGLVGGGGVGGGALSLQPGLINIMPLAQTAAASQAAKEFLFISNWSLCF